MLSYSVLFLLTSHFVVLSSYSTIHVSIRGMLFYLLSTLHIVYISIMYYNLERLDQPVQILLIVYINAQLVRPIVINMTFCGAQLIFNN